MQRTFWRKGKRWRTPLHWIGKYFDGQWDDIQGIFQSFKKTFSLSSWLKQRNAQQLQAAISHQIPACSSWYTENTSATNKRQLLPHVVALLLCGYTEVEIWMQQNLHRVAAGQSCALIFKNQFPSEQLIWHLCAATSLRVIAWSLKTVPLLSAVSITLSCLISVHFNNFHFVFIECADFITDIVFL